MTVIAVPPMLIDQALPACDAVRTEHRVIPGDVTAAYAAVRRADFMRAGRESPAVRALFGARTVAERAVSAARRRGAAEPPPPASLRLADLTEHGEWVLLGEDPPHEIAFGAVGRFWGGETAWEEIDAAGFAAFDRPGYARIACNFSVRPYGSGQALVSYECRTQATDPAARRAFLRYWRPLSPFIGVVLRAQLAVVAAEARAAAAPSPRLVRSHARLGTRVRLDDGGEFAVFRETTVAGLATERPAVLAVRFHLSATRPAQHRLHRLFQHACILTTPFFVHTPGYRTKLWAYDPETGDYAGVYQWDGADRADAYARSLVPILRALSRRGSVAYRVYADERLDDHLAVHARPRYAVTPSQGARSVAAPGRGAGTRR